MAKSEFNKITNKDSEIGDHPIIQNKLECESGVQPNSVSGAYRYGVASFLGGLILMFIAMPLIEKLNYGNRIAVGIMTLVLLSAVAAVGNSRKTLVWAILLVIPAVAARWAHHLRPDIISETVFFAAGMLFLIFVIAHLFHFVLRTQRIDSEVLCAAIAIYLVMAMLWAFAYAIVAEMIPDSFVFTAGPSSLHVMKGYTALYFSCVTLCTVGYGDIVPVSEMARALAIAEAAFGVFYVAMMISRLVALYSSKASRDNNTT